MITTRTARVAPEKAAFRPALPSVPYAGFSPERTMAKMTYAEQLKHPNWQRKRLEALESTGFSCENCGDKDTTLHVHHKLYVKGRMAWEYELEELAVLCEPCHESHHRDETILQELILRSGNLQQVVALVAGFYHRDTEQDPATLYAAREGDVVTYALGFLANLTNHLSAIDKIHQVAQFAVSLSRANSEARPLFEACQDVFGKD